MKTYRKESILIGLFFLIAMAGSLFGAGLIETVLTAPDVIAAAAANTNVLISGGLLELLCAVCVVGIAMFMAPILRSIDEKLAYGYLGFRIVEAVFCTLITIAPFTLAAISQVPTGVDSAASMKLIGQIVILMRTFFSGLPLSIFFCLGAFILYFALFRSGLLPKFIAVWGLIAVTLVFVMNIAGQFIHLEMTVNMVLALPIILNEVFMGFWLIFKGFSTAVSQAIKKELSGKKELK